MRLVFLSHSGDLGGAERDLLELAIDLRDQFHATPLIVVPADGEFSAQASRSGLEYFVADYPWAWSDSAWVSERTDHDLRGLVEYAFTQVLGPILARIATFEPTAIVSQSCVIPWGVLLSKSLSVPHIWNIREFGDLDHGLVPWLRGACTPSDIGALSETVYGCSQTVAEEWQKRLGRPVKVLYSSPRFQENGGQVLNDKKGETGPNDALSIVHVGSLARSKNPVLLVKALQLLASRGRAYSATFIGTGPDEQQVRTLAEDLDVRIDFVGRTTEIGELLRSRFHAIVSCAPHEAMGRSLREGALLGTVPVYPDIKSWDECFVNGVNGIQYKVNDAASLADALEKLYDVKVRQRLASRAATDASTGFGHDNASVVFMNDLSNWLSSAREDLSPEPLSNLVSMLLDSIGILVSTRTDLMQSVARYHESLTQSRLELGALKADLETIREQKRISENTMTDPPSQVAIQRYPRPE